MNPEDSAFNFPAGDPNNVRRVRFSPYPEVHKEIPWLKKKDQGILDNDDVLYPLHSSLKYENSFHLRTVMENDDISLFGIAVLIACLFILFVMIWFVVNKILLLEIETQVSEHSENRGRLHGMAKFI